MRTPFHTTPVSGVRVVIAVGAFGLLGGGAPAGADELHVPAEFPTIAAALLASIDGDEIILADGVYFGTGNVKIELDGRAVTIRSANGPDACIIDAQEKDWHFLFRDSETATTRIEGLTLHRGVGDGLGGSIACIGASPEFVDCAFTACRTLEEVCGETGCHWSGAGGAVSLISSSSRFVRCRFAGNQAVIGGAVFAGTGAARFEDCSFADNWCADGDALPTAGGGAVSVSGVASFVRCVFTGNRAAAGGHVAVHGGGSANFEDCTLAGGVADAAGFSAGAGGAFWIAGSSVALYRCSIMDNDALGGDTILAGRGGGAFVFGGSLNLVNCVLARNSATAQEGGPLPAAGAAIEATTGLGTSHAILVGCTLTRNDAGADGTVLLTDVDSTIDLRSSIVHGNTGALDGAGLTASYSNIESGWPGEGNLDVDPEFVSSDDSRLLGTSPCIDAGDAAAFTAPDGDLDRAPRVLDVPTVPDTGTGGCPVPDMGAYEYQHAVLSCCPGDVNDDGIVAVSDLLEVLGAWGQAGSFTDLDGDGVVGVGDLLIVLAGWGVCAG